MKNNPNLRFLLALANQKVIVLEKAKNMHVYASANSPRENVSVKKLSALIHTK